MFMKKNKGIIWGIMLMFFLLRCTTFVYAFTGTGYQTATVGDIITVSVPEGTASCCLWSLAGEADAAEIISSSGRTCRIRAKHSTNKRDVIVHCQYMKRNSAAWCIYDCYVNIRCKDHWYDGGVITRAATCKSNGNIKYTCQMCGYLKNQTILKTDAHYFDEGIVTLEPTSDREGIRTYTCSVCGQKKIEEIIYVGGPEPTEPELTEPEPTEPEPTEPEPTEPEPTEPEPTEPEPTEPEPTEPEPTEPEPTSPGSVNGMPVTEELKPNVNDNCVSLKEEDQELEAQQKYQAREEEKELRREKREERAEKRRQELEVRMEERRKKREERAEKRRQELEAQAAERRKKREERAEKRRLELEARMAERHKN